MFEYDFYEGRRKVTPAGWVVLFCLVIFTATFVLAACGPHELTPAEQHAQKVKEQREKAAKAKQEAAKKLAEAKKKAAEARVKAAQEKARIAAMPPTPPGIEQMDSTHFYVHTGFEGNTRDLCRTSQTDSPAGIASIDPAPNGSDIIITCANAEHEYRHAPIITTAQPAPKPAK